MPGTGNLLRVEFSGRTPWPAVLLTGLLFANLLGSFGLDYWLEHYAPHAPSVASSFPVRLRPSVAAFVPSWLGHYEQWSFWLHFVFLGLLLVLFCWYAIKGQAIIRIRSTQR